MANEDYNAELYFKMQDSMDRYIDWLKNQPADEILNHTYEYTVKQDILMAFEEMDLSDAQAKALLNTKDPLEEVFKHFEKQETGYMQTLRDCITERGDELAVAQAEDRTIVVISVEPGKEPVLKEISPGLESLQHEVGGDIEATYPFDDPVALLCNEEGKLTGLTLNRALCDGDGEIYDIIAGSFLIVGCGDEDFTTVPAELTDKYIEMFKQPETFMRYNGEILAIKDNEKDKIPVYLGSGADARMSGELDAYRISFKTNMECKKAIEQAISEGYHDNTMKDVLAEPVIEKYGLQRVKTVLAITCIEKDWDARISRTNKEWAKTVPVPKGEDGMGGNNNAYLVCEKPHIGLVNIFIDKVRAFEDKQLEKKPSVLGKLDEAKNKITPPVPKNNHKKEKSL